jgi:hypothetical protein
VITELKEGIKEAEHALSLEKSEREKEAAEGEPKTLNPKP